MTMPSKFLAVLAVVLASGFVGCANLTDVSTPSSGKISAVEGLFPTLTKGMTADVIRQKLGAPEEIEPMNSPTGHAEVWVYHFEKADAMILVATGLTQIPVISPSSAGPVTVMIPESILSPIEQKSLVTLRLLMFNGELTAQKALIEKRFGS